MFTPGASAPIQPPPVVEAPRGLGAAERGLILGILVVAVIGVLYFLGRQGEAPDGIAAATQAPTRQPTAAPSITVIIPDVPAAKPATTPAAGTEYAKLSDRDWQLLVKSPDAKAGNAYFVWACITQFDAATGPEGFLAQASNAKREYWYTDGDNAVFTGTAAQLADFVEHDVVAARVISNGSYSYDTQAGGNTTVPAFEVQAISAEGSCE